MRILIAAGGSGGHIFPAVALARTLKERSRDIEIKFIGSNKILDRRIFEKEGFDFSLLSANKLPYKPSFRMIAFAMKLFFDMIRIFFIIKMYKPDAVVGFGGYVAGPVVLAARRQKIPIMIHEQNVVPGRANKSLFKVADRIAISFEETRRYLGSGSGKAVFTGNPIRVNIFSAKIGKSDKENVIKKFGFDMNKFTILVIGGSQGAHFLNENFMKALDQLDMNTRQRLQVIHITGLKDYEQAIAEYKKLGVENHVYSFIDRIEDAYSASDLVVTRSGASAIFEVALFGRPMILVPYPFAMSHQAENARVFSNKGAAIEIAESDLSADVFRDNITGLLNDRKKLERMAQAARTLSVPDSAYNLAGQVLELARR